MPRLTTAAQEPAIAAGAVEPLTTTRALLVQLDEGAGVPTTPAEIVAAFRMLAHDQRRTNSTPSSASAAQVPTTHGAPRASRIAERNTRWH